MGVLRLLLAICVVSGHSSSIFGFRLPDGSFAVECFFMISGFYMALILNEKYTGKHSSYKLFILNRLLRIYPIYYLILLLSITSGVILTSKGVETIITLFQHSHLTFFSWMFFIVTSLTVVGQDLVHFLGLHSGHLYFSSHFLDAPYPPAYMFLFIPQAWTLSLEVVFYLIVPFIVKRRTFFLAAVIFILLGLRFYFYHKGLNYDPWTYRFLPFEFVFFFSGALIYRLYARIKNAQIDERIGLVLWLSSLAIVIFYSFIPTTFFSVIDIKLWLSYLFILVSIPFIFHYSKKRKFDQWIGDLSYPVYISHMLVVFVLIGVVPSIQLTPYYGVVVIGISVLFSIVIQELFGKKLDRFRQMRFKKSMVKNKIR